MRLSTAHYKLSPAYAAMGRQEDAKREMNLFLKIRAAKSSLAAMGKR
jgi:hypothetical protein